MHRIALRGPWRLTVFDDRLEASRKFHAPPGFATESPDALKSEAVQESPPIFFAWCAAIEPPVTAVRLNQHVIRPIETSLPHAKPNFTLEETSGVGRADLSGILRPFNEISLIWNDWPSTWQVVAGRYSPDPLHPFHFDSWLEISN